MSLFPLIEADDLAGLKAQVNAGADVNEVREGNETVLIAAAKAGLLEHVRVLLDAGADPQWKDDAQETALLKAAANGYRAVTALLIDESPPDERELAKAFLAAYGQAHGPEYEPPPSFVRTVAEVSARASAFVGHQSPQQRIDRLERAEKKKR